MVKWLCAALLFALAACAQQTPPPQETAAPPSLELVWRLDGFANPESVALSEDESFLFVTNVNGEADAQDGNGFISRVSLTGELLEREWAGGLDGPKGIVRVGALLYVADIDEIAVIAAIDGSTRERIAAPGAGFLNDAALAPGGEVLVADSANARIYAVRDGAASVWLEDDLLRSVNGLLPETERLVVTTMQGRLLAVDYQTRAISVLAEGLGDADGVGPRSDGGYLVSEWPGAMYAVAPDGTRRTILETRDDGRYLNDFLLIGDALYQPHWEPSELSAYRVVQAAP